MTTTFSRLLRAAPCALALVVSSAMATPISGTIGFSDGLWSPNDSDVTKITQIGSFGTGLYVVFGDGSFAGLEFGNVVMKEPLSWAPGDDYTSSPLWKVYHPSTGLQAFEFTLTSLTATPALGDPLLGYLPTLSLTGRGIVTDGANSAEGIWSWVGVVGGNSYFTYDTNDTVVGVPDSTATVTLLGIGLLGLRIASRRKR